MDNLDESIEINGMEPWTIEEEKSKENVSINKNM